MKSRPDKCEDIGIAKFKLQVIIDELAEAQSSLESILRVRAYLKTGLVGDESELREFVSEMRGPDARGIDDTLADSDSDPGASVEVETPAATAEGPFADEEAAGDGFDHDIVLPEERLPYEDDFAHDEGEDLDLDKLPEDEYFPAGDEDNL